MPGEVNPSVFSTPLYVPRGSNTTPAIVFAGLDGSANTANGIWSSETSVIDFNVGSTGTVAIHSQLSVSTIVQPVRTSSSITTGGGLLDGQIFISAGASGLSIGVFSGGTVYYINSSVSTS